MLEPASVPLVARRDASAQSSYGGANPVAVGADQIALCHLVLNLVPCPAVRDEVRDAGYLEIPHMVPVETASPLTPAAIIATTPELDGIVPVLELKAPTPGRRQPIG